MPNVGVFLGGSYKHISAVSRETKGGGGGEWGWGGGGCVFFLAVMPG